MKDKACSLRPSQKAVKISKHHFASMPAKENDVYMGKGKMICGDRAEAQSEGREKLLGSSRVLCPDYHLPAWTGQLLGTRGCLRESGKQLCRRGAGALAEAWRCPELILFSREEGGFF